MEPIIRKLIDECDVDDVADKVLHRPFMKVDDIRVELVLKNAAALYERVGPDVSEIFSKPSDMPGGVRPKVRMRDIDSWMELGPHDLRPGNS